MPRSTPSRPAPRQVDFHRTKYGRELLLDAAFVRDLQGFERTGRAHTLRFYDILFVTRGSGTFAIDDRVHHLEPGSLFFSRPGEVRRLVAPDLDGLCLFFRGDFMEEAMSDPRFLDELAYFRPDRPTGKLSLTPAEARLFRRRFSVMRREIAALRADSSHALRAALYEILVLLQRWYVARHGESRRTPRSRTLERFLTLVETEFPRVHRVADYARALGTSPDHLNTLCRSGLRRTCGDWIRHRLTLEAKRLLLYSDLTAAEIADRLGFADPAYFARFFRREAGAPPTSYRADRRFA